MSRGDRAVTSPIEYVLTIAIATILIAGVIIAATAHVNDQRTRTTHAQMDAVAQQVAGNLEKAERLVEMDGSPDGPTDLRLESDLPDQILGNGYRVTIEDSDSKIRVDSTATDQSVTIEYDVDLSVTDSGGDDPQIRGGSIVIKFDSPDKLEVIQ